jgi:hypothetical protein
MTTTNNTETTTATTKTKVADRYHALVMHAYTLPEFTFTRSKKPTTKDCDELSEAIAKYEAGLADVIEMAKAAPSVEAAPVITALPSNVVDALANPATLDQSGADVTEKPLTSKEEQREEARAKFYNATKATKAHAYAVLAAATNDGDRRALIRAKLEELPEVIRAGTCKIAMTLVPSGSTMHEDIKFVHDEQPAGMVGPRIPGVRSLSTETSVRKNGYVHVFVGEGVDAAFVISKSVVDGKIVYTLTQK